MLMAVTPDPAPLPDTPSFPEFYRAINGRDPFPWQSRLADQVADTEAWPEEVGVPTGLGKTACLDIAVWWLASQADRKPADRTAPTRIWWLVNRRLLVDSTTDHAQAISHALSDPARHGLSGTECDVVRAVADRLRSLAADRDAEPLEVIRLRGGVAARLPADPSRPAVVLSTLPMYGSRLLFRGYGSSRSMRPIDAAMAGTDSLVIVDEAHLAPHLIAVLPAAAECTPNALPILGPARSRPLVVALTATGDATNGGRFDLDADDEAHPVVQQRLDAVKPMALRVESGAVGQRLVDATLSLLKDANAPASCLVFANTPATARDAFRRLARMIETERAEILLLTGRAREREAERTRQRILDPRDGMPSTRDRSKRRQRHLIVVATQTLEVGADVDAEYLVTEACGVRALTQRLGRLNRLGRYPHARAVYVHVPPTSNRRTRSEQPGEWPVYGLEPAAVLQRLHAAARGAPDGTVDVAPRRVAEILGPPGDDPGRAPEILQGVLWEWVKTTSPPAGEAPVEPYFSGIAAPEYTVSLIWRAHVPVSGDMLWPRAMDRETVDVPLHEAREAFDEADELRRLGTDGVTIETTTPAELRAGNVIVLASDCGLLDEYGWDPQASSPVADISIAEHGLPLDAEAIRRLCGISVGALVTRALGVVDDDEDLDEADRDEAVEQILAELSAAAPSGWEKAEWNAVVDALEPRVVIVRDEVARLPMPSAREPRSDELDEMSRADTAVELERHGVAVAARARSIAERIGISPELASIVERAGRLHDLGKADARFQRWLDPDDKQAVPLAKSQMRRSEWTAARVAAGWPRGGRHEELSTRLIRHWLATHANRFDSPLADLLIHLVVSHHGSGRPLVRPVPDHTTDEVYAQIDGAAVNAAANLSIINWDQPARFVELNERFGPWGLALLEAIVRRADHTVSAGARVSELEVI